MSRWTRLSERRANASTVPIVRMSLCEKSHCNRLGMLYVSNCERMGDHCGGGGNADNRDAANDTTKQSWTRAPHPLRPRTEPTPHFRTTKVCRATKGSIKRPSDVSVASSTFPARSSRCSSRTRDGSTHSRSCDTPSTRQSGASVRGSAGRTRRKLYGIKYSRSADTR